MLVFARIANWSAAALLVLAVLGFLFSISEAVADYDREPEDLWIILDWIAGLCLLTVLCLVNAARARRTETAADNRLTAINVIVLIGLIILKALDTSIGNDDPVLTALVALCALGPAAAVIAALQVSFVKRH